MKSRSQTYFSFFPLFLFSFFFFPSYSLLTITTLSVQLEKNHFKWRWSFLDSLKKLQQQKITMTSLTFPTTLCRMWHVKIYSFKMFHFPLYLVVVAKNHRICFSFSLFIHRVIHFYLFSKTLIVLPGRFVTFVKTVFTTGTGVFFLVRFCKWEKRIKAGTREEKILDLSVLYLRLSLSASKLTKWRSTCQAYNWLLTDLQYLIIGPVVYQD